MARSGERYEAMRTATEEKVRAAAIRLFARSGFGGTTMRDIAREAGISPGSIYRHYETKEELFGQLVGQAAGGLRQLAHLFQGSESPAAILRRFVAEVLGGIDGGGDFPEFFLIMNQSFGWQDGPPEIRSLVDAQSVAMEAAERLIGRGQQLGEFRDGDPAELATCFFAALSGLATMKLALRDRLVVPSTNVLTAFLIEDSHDD
ncbi:TetR/AcrR family transcriptional regulator [Nocardia australiensis]|uniref:TetR/AcrR family transcriptional regulator n=1 Tax=Nocardia australiensis TaxID=2887191 RepID=UPI001D149FC7|nr:TetR/AcrR family transcriptional regulator [Nocardia australiensis]